MAFAVAFPAREPRVLVGRRRPGTSTRMCDGTMNSPASIARAWNAERKQKSVSDLVSQRHVNVLIVSYKCERALLAERLLQMHAHARSRSRRLLIHSAGLECVPGAALPHALLQFAAARGITVPEAQPCARFDPASDFEFYDLLLAVDRDVLESTKTLAERQARAVTGSLADWERKIRLFTDIEGKVNMDAVSQPSRVLDIPRFENVLNQNTAVDFISFHCTRALDSLIRRGL